MRDKYKQSHLFQVVIFISHYNIGYYAANYNTYDIDISASQSYIPLHLKRARKSCIICIYADKTGYEKSMRKALTIGELLITMSIIGIIAVLVLPGFLQDYHKKLYTTGLKKTYEMLTNAINQACTDSNVSYFYQTLYVRSEKNPSTNKSYQQEFINKYFKIVKSDEDNPFADKYKAIQSSTENSITIATNSGVAKLTGGEAVAFSCPADEDYCIFQVDVNNTAAPNLGGRDYFTIYINKKTNELYDSETTASCGLAQGSGGGTVSYNYEGKGCLARIMQENWEMKY